MDYETKWKKKIMSIVMILIIISLVLIIMAWSGNSKTYTQWKSSDIFKLS